MSGRLRIIGLGPGPASWLTPEAGEALAEASDILGYAPYVARHKASSHQRLHPSDNRVEAERAAHALQLAASGHDVALVSGGDPGVFAMAAALVEALEALPLEARDIDISILPGVTAVLAAAARLGAPLGGDFCVMSLSDNLKPWKVIKNRLDAANAGDFVLALYNPASKARPRQIFEAFDILRAGRAPATPVAFARAIGRDDERILRCSLADADPAEADMSTLVLIGASHSRWVARPHGEPFLLTPRAVQVRP
ncbi:MAG: precorrin-3B C(17)-methyltransferase [Hyphomicrobiales bacterium]|nr:precorrin-3B C(17)-methyltransferase [Hyphomicrobiales bacterium]